MDAADAEARNSIEVAVAVLKVALVKLPGSSGSATLQ
jgi:hypothetical protein